MADRRETEIILQNDVVLKFQWLQCPFFLLCTASLRPRMRTEKCFKEQLDGRKKKKKKINNEKGTTKRG